MRDRAWAAVVTECRRATDVGLGLTEDDFVLPTRLPAWNVRQLYGHLWRGMDRLRTGLGQPPPPAVDTDAFSYWRSYDPGTDGPDIADRAAQIAAGYASGLELIRSFDRVWREGVEAASAAPADRVIATWGPALRLGDFVATRALEVGVHGLDLADALGREPWISPEAIDVIRPVLTSLLGSLPPAVQTWDDVRFIEIGTGRRPLSRTERLQVGPLANRFPLLA